MMRDDRKPVWEEAYNCQGGTFRLRVQKKDTVIHILRIPHIFVLFPVTNVVSFVEQSLEGIADGCNWGAAERICA